MRFAMNSISRAVTTTNFDNTDRVRQWPGSILPLLVVSAFALAACNSSTDTPASEEDQMTVEPTSSATQAPEPGATEAQVPAPAPEPETPEILDDRTLIVPAGFGLFSNHRSGSMTSETPTPDEIALVLAHIDSASDLAWAQTHTRAFYTVVDDGQRHIEVAFACGIEPITTDEQATAAVYETINPPLGGGDCYGSALFSTEGELLSWRTNGES